MPDNPFTDADGQQSSGTEQPPQQMDAPQTTSRKRDHVELVVNRDVAFRAKSAGFERVEFVHNAVPELNFADIDSRSVFLGQTLSAPLMISCMTGGYAEAEVINAALGAACEQENIAMGVGSQRQALENSQFIESFRAARRAAPSIPIVANIGAAEVAAGMGSGEAQKLVDMIEANALTVHLNPLQELLQPEGNTQFAGVLAGIEQLAGTLNVPIIAKEVGAGISAAAAERLLDSGVMWIDVAGAGGTSWAGVEILRRSNPELVDMFWDWGIPTVDCLIELHQLQQSRGFGLVGSGGLTSGLDLARTIRLGADLGAAARPFVRALKTQGEEALHAEIRAWKYQLRAAMFLTGSATLEELSRAECRLAAPGKQ